MHDTACCRANAAIVKRLQPASSLKETGPDFARSVSFFALFACRRDDRVSRALLPRHPQPLHPHVQPGAMRGHSLLLQRSAPLEASRFRSTSPRMLLHLLHLPVQRKALWHRMGGQIVRHYPRVR